MPFKDLETRRIYDREYRRKNLEKVREKKRWWYYENIGKYRVWGTAYRMKHLERMIEKQRRYWRDIKLKVFHHYFGDDPKCIRCGIDDIRVLQMHHVNGGGSKHRKTLFGSPHTAGPRFYRWLIKNNFPSDIPYEPYCANCHIIMRFKEEAAEIT